MEILRIVVRIIDRLNEGIGRIAGLAVLLLVLVQFLLVLGGAVFAYGSIWLQESRLYLNALMFLGAAGYALKYDAHVRVDLLFREADRVTRAWVDFAGAFIFLMPFLFLIWRAGIPYVLDSWAIRQGSIETGGIPFVYGLKTTILIFAATVSLQGIAVLIRQGALIYTGRREPL